MIAVDLFAGTGWGVACKRLGIDEKGVELMAEAVATREANGMHTIYNDVWDGLLLSRAQHEMAYGCYELLIASPPCQTFSVAGHGAGRKALDEVIEAIQLHAYKDPAELLAFGEKHDMRTALVLSPLAYIYRDMPRLVALEQVPTVLPVWEAYAEIMRDLGYDVKTAIVNAEQYGVPQTRRRAILVARLDGPVSLPTPTHSRYYPRTPDKLDAGVLPWISMAQALGWNGPVIYTQNNKLAHQSRRPLDHPAPTVTAGHDSGNRGFIDTEGNFTIATTDEVAALQSYPTARGLTNRPSPTITGGGTETGGAEPIAKFHERYTSDPGWAGSTARLSPEEAAALQSYPIAATKVQTKGRVEKYGDRPDRSAESPAFTVVGHDGHPRGGFQFKNEDGSTRRATVEELAALQTYPVELRPEIEDWKWKDAPATTVAGDPRITAREHHYHGEQHSTSLRITAEEASRLQTYPTMLRSNYGTSGNAQDKGERTVQQPAPTLTSKANRNKWDGTKGMQLAEASALQTYEAPFEWRGSKTKQFLQIGNAVPPLLAQAILTALIEPTKAAPKRRRTTRKLL